jgi:putative flippase GtrA
VLTSQVKIFLIVGLINTMFYYFLYSIFLYIGIEYKLSALFSTIFGSIFSFKTIGGLVFDNANNSLIYKFLFVYLLIYLVNISLIDLFNSVFFNYYISGFVSIIVCAFISFLLNKFYVFKQEIL